MSGIDFGYLREEIDKASQTLWKAEDLNTKRWELGDSIARIAAHLRIRAPHGDPRAPELPFATCPKAPSRRADPRTSKDAAGKVNLTKGRRDVLLALGRIQNGTDKDIFEELRAGQIAISRSGARTRRRELVDGGLAFPAGRHPEQAATIWSLTKQGREKMLSLGPVGGSRR